MPIYGNKEFDEALQDIIVLKKDLPEVQQANAVGLIFKNKYQSNVTCFGRKNLTMKDCFKDIYPDMTLSEWLGDLKVLADYTETGTCFLASNQLILTAKHVISLSKKIIEQKDVEEFRVIFMGWWKNSKQTIEKSDVFEIDSIIDQGKDHSDDWILLKLKKKVQGIRNLVIDYNSSIITNKRIYMLGFPFSLPQKRSMGTVINNNDTTIDANIDGFVGNSGSPVFNLENNNVIGIYTFSSEDFDLTDKTKVGLNRNGIGIDRIQKIPKLE